MIALASAYLRSIRAQPLVRLGADVNWIGEDPNHFFASDAKPRFDAIDTRLLQHILEGSALGFRAELAIAPQFPVDRKRSLRLRLEPLLEAYATAHFKAARR